MKIEIYASDINQEFASVAENADPDEECLGNGPNPYYNGTDYAVPAIGDEFLFREESFGGLIYNRRTGEVYKFEQVPYQMVKFLRINGKLLNSRGQRVELLKVLFPDLSDDNISDFFETLKSMQIGHLVEKIS